MPEFILRRVLPLIRPCSTTRSLQWMLAEAYALGMRDAVDVMEGGTDAS